MSETNTIKAREAIAAEHKWQLSDLYETAEAWEVEMRAVQAETDAMKQVQEALRPEKDSILATLQASNMLSRRLMRLFTYARMLRDEDSRNAAAQGMADRAQSLVVQGKASLAFLTPALLEMPEALLLSCMEDAAFSDFDRELSDVLRNRPHTLPKEQETLLAQAAELAQAPDTIYTLLTEADLTFPDILGEDGTPTPMSDARLLPHLRSHDPRVRRDAWETVMQGYGKLGSTFAATYGGSVKGDVFFSRARHFASAREASLFENEIPVSVYDALLQAVNAHLPALNRYQTIKQKMLGLPELHMWDLYAEPTRDFEMNLSYDEAYALMLEALAPLGKEYTAIVKEAKNAGWIDIYENQGKHHGAYSWGSYGVHPYILLNYQGSLDDASTLAHEMGHAMHSFFSNRAQPHPKSHYTLFAAEVASTVNEVLLVCHLLDKHKDKAAQQSLLGTLLENFRTTVFRQTLFATFEMEAHAMQERGEPLTKESLSELYYGINQRFYGNGCTVDDLVRSEWMRIPHFYRAFYVYQYATGYSAAVCIARKILKEGAPAVAGYMRFLSAGSALPPIEALRLADVDMETPQPVEEALTWFDEIVEQFDALS